MKIAWILLTLIVPLASGQISNIAVSTTATQSILQYSSPVDEACTLKVADMNRLITIVSGTYSNGIVTITTSASHGLSAGTGVYLDNTGVSGWNGWRTVSAATATQFTFAVAAPGSTTTGAVGVLIADVDPTLFTGADLDSRSGNLTNGRSRVFVVGKRAAEIASDGRRYTRAQQANSRHHFTLTCGAQVLDQDYTTKNLPLGDTHNDGPAIDRAHPGQYAYPTVNWTNAAQSLIDPLTGVRSFRATSPTGAPSGSQTFRTAIDADSAWGNPAGPLTAGGGAATFTGPCQGTSCWLFLRADALTLLGGATYTSGPSEGSSLDWVAATITGASINSGSCTGDDCKIVACLTVNGVSCNSADREITLTATPASYTVGTKTTIDLWQASGTVPGFARPDASAASGTLNYVASTRAVTWASGHKFSIKWTAGSRIAIAGSEYSIASVQSEVGLKLVSGPGADLSGAAYSAQNFGVLIRKKTATANQVSIGYTTFEYGSTALPAWASLSVDSCGPTAVVVGGRSGYNCFVDRELYWLSSDGAELRDLGLVGLSWWNDGRWSTGSICGSGSDFSLFDPLDGDTWYCLIRTYPFGPSDRTATSIVKATYGGAHTARTPGLLLPDCGLNGNTQPCVTFTLMQPNRADSVEYAGPAFNPEYAASGYQAAYFLWGGISAHGDFMVYTREADGQDTKGWQFMFTLGDRTPAGTTANSIRPIAAASSYRHAPTRWCAIHTSGTPKDDRQAWGCNPFWRRGAAANYAMALTSPLLNTTVDAAGGLNTCPSNSFGATGKSCTDITVSGEPTRVGDSNYLQSSEPGDIIVAADLDPWGAPVYATAEYMRILTKTDSQHMTVQRGYAGDEYPPRMHSSATLVMVCGAFSTNGYNTAWDYKNDPYGLNASGLTNLIDGRIAGHVAWGQGLRVSSAGGWYNMGNSKCPKDLLGSDGLGSCYEVTRGTLPAALRATALGVSANPAFGGRLGIGNSNQVDSHPGPCQSDWCLDGRVMNGDTHNMAGSAASPWVNTSGQLWKLSGGAAALSTKSLTTMAYVGRSPLVDISGPGSVIPENATGSYQYCIAGAANECRAGSAVSDIYVNAPYVSLPYCYYAGNAVQADDTNSICVGPLGAYTGNIVQMGVTSQDWMGSMSRRLGTFFSRWNQQDVYWNALSTPSGSLIFNQARWLDGVRHEDLISILPPYPAGDSIARNSFLPVEVKITPPAARLVDNAIVEFGYAENGAADKFYCTSRQETCVAVAGNVNAQTPFFFAQSESYSGAPCALGCTVTIPALSQRVLYYRWKYRDASGQAIAVGDTSAIATP